VGAMTQDTLEAVRDPRRLDALRETGLLDSEVEAEFDRLTRLAARLLGVPATFFSLVDEDRDFYKSCFGFAEPLASERQLTGVTFCHYSLVAEGALVIPDTRADPVYRTVPTVESLGVAAYLGVPVHAPTGEVLGSFCAINFQPHDWSPLEVETMKELAKSAEREVALRHWMRQQNRLVERERAARAESERRAREEAALRHAAEAVTAAFTVEEVIRRIAESALIATNADGAFVKRIDPDLDEVRVVAVAGQATPPLNTRAPYVGSFTERVTEGGEPLEIVRREATEHPFPEDLFRHCGNCSALVIPLLDASGAIGTLFLIRQAENQGFRPDEMARAHTFGNLAALAFRKVHLLQDSENRREELEQVMESRARLIRGFSHDVKNPLGAADGFLALLEDGILGELTEKQRATVGRVRRSIGTALGLINDLVEIARAEAGQLEIRQDPLDVREVVREMAEEYRAQAEAKGLRIRSERPEVCPVIRSDSTRVRQILGNLISNAVKYTREGHVVVSVATRSQGSGSHEGGWVVLEVSDTGPGIPEEKRHLLFREFSRLDPEAGHGAGLGLAISRRIAEALGGSISVESEVGRGSTFALWLPLAGGPVEVAVM
jgi:signal transduction histidine kinase